MVLIDIRVDTFDEAAIFKLLPGNIAMDKMQSIQAMIDTNQLIHYTPDVMDELRLPHRDVYVPKARTDIIIPIPRAVWDINSIRNYLKTGNFPFRGRQLHMDHFAIGISQTAANLAVREWRGFLERIGPSRYKFIHHHIYHARLGFLKIPKLTWTMDELAKYIAKEREYSYDGALMIAQELKMRMFREGGRKYRFRDFDMKTSFGSYTYLYPIKPRVGIFVSMTGKDKGYTIPLKLEMFHHIPLEWGEEREYDFLYKLLSYAVTIWTEEKYNLSDLLGVSDPEHRWHPPSLEQLEQTIKIFDAEEFPEGFNYRKEANIDRQFPNFFTAMYFKKIELDSIFCYFQKDGLKQKWRLVERLPVEYIQILQKEKIPRYWDGKIMKEAQG